jgi:CRP-like cAMP-binding protein
MLMMLGHFRAEERLDYFLRHEARRTPGGEIHLPMTMSDLAIYLGLRHETLSRVVTLMAQRGVLRRLPDKRFLYRPETARQATG